MSLQEALNKSDQSGREGVYNYILTLGGTIAVTAVLLSIANGLGLINIDVGSMIKGLIASKFTLPGVAVLIAGAAISYAGGFSKMFKKYNNTGKLGGLALLALFIGGGPVALQLVGVPVPVPDWTLIGAAAIALFGAGYYGDQRRKQEECQ